jgi:hypothetical protein
MPHLIAATSTLLALSPWVLPSLAAAAKLGREEARDTCHNEFGQNRSDGSDGMRDHVIDERFKERVQALIWPE